MTMETADPSAIQRNRDLMREFERALEINPAVNLKALIPDSYVQTHVDAQSQRPETATAELNRRTLDEIQCFLRDNPEVDLLSIFPPDYSRRRGFAAQISEGMAGSGRKELPKPPDFRTRLDAAETAEIIFPLSNDVTALLAAFSDASNGYIGTEQSLLSAIRRLLWESKILWESPIRGIVVQCNDDIVAKVIGTNGDYTEYTALRYLAEQIPEIPAPRPYGMIVFGSFCMIFMSYIPSMTLTEAWPSLSHEQKISVQHQLDDIFRRLRTVRRGDGHSLGGVGGEGVKGHEPNTTVSTAAEFEDFRYSAPHHGSTTYANFLRSFLTDPVQGSVFTHGDVRQDNILVKLNQDNVWIVTGIIDWEDSGFYPEYHECTELTRTMSLTEEDDWYLYLPASISPLQFPIRWLVDRLFDIHIKTT
ncbi:uncharacterized protein N7515_006321 [Penicillium bovifimosum]|uniref:Aminoglycoside phosphotransferase domain-containing protein n=1 Tax=Penicillium bovifimosum TaxID=126998 RepID=A0A9W9GUJ6_9EURO|nr:uncharacterized protein N7515_006321 [Penicillium bovifimosum]KAJ5130282.1 hypothetical protein N7515_006321 [Penicillium bovifimosum]